MKALIKLNSTLERSMPLLTPLGIIMGVIFSSFFINLRPFIPWLFGAMTLSGALKLKSRDLFQAVRNPLPILFFFLTAHFVMPVITMLISTLVFGNDPDTVSGYVLIYSVPTAVSSFIWVSIYRGDPALSLTMILLDSVLAPLVVPFTVRLLLGTKIILDMSGMALSLLFMVVIPTLVGVITNETSRGTIPKIVTPYLNPLAKIFLILVVSANCSAVAPQINLQNTRIWIIGVMCIVFSAMGFSLGKLTGLLGRRLGLLGNTSKGESSLGESSMEDTSKEKQVSLFFALGLRNISAAMILGIEFFPPAAALPAVLGIVFQQSMAALMGKLYLGKIPEEEPAANS
jgi:tagaturonate reductase